MIIYLVHSYFYISNVCTVVNETIQQLRFQFKGPQLLSEHISQVDEKHHL